MRSCFLAFPGPVSHLDHQLSAFCLPACLFHCSTQPTSPRQPRRSSHSLCCLVLVATISFPETSSFPLIPWGLVGLSTILVPCTEAKNVPFFQHVPDIPRSAHPASVPRASFLLRTIPRRGVSRLPLCVPCSVPFYRVSAKHRQAVFPSHSSNHLLPAGGRRTASTVAGFQDESNKDRKAKEIEQSHLPRASGVHRAHQRPGCLAKSECQLGQRQG